MYTSPQLIITKNPKADKLKKMELKKSWDLIHIYTLSLKGFTLSINHNCYKENNIHTDSVK
jgi:hypothetical protein